MPRKTASGPDRRLSPSSPQRGTGKTWTRRDRAARRARMAIALPLVIDGVSPAKIALQLGVVVSTVYDWMHDPEFAEELAEARRRAVSEAIVRLEFSVGVAVDTLIAIEKGGTKEDAPRVKAAEAHLDRAGIVKRTIIVHETDEGLEGEDDETLLARREEELAAEFKAKGWRPPE